MRAFHDSRKAEYRSPYGAVEAGGAVSLSLDVFEAPEAACECRVWVDGKGERLVPMERTPLAGGARFVCALPLPEPELVWYSFIIRTPEGTSRYGARQGRTGGEGAQYQWEPPSFQITVYERRAAPDWYKRGIVYQIFPDRFRRGPDFRERAAEALKTPRKGPARAFCEDWYAVPRYEKDAAGRVTRWDFYGGTLSGVREKLPYLRELGVTALYFNPIFEAASSHRYDTGDYEKLDAMLGGPGEFERLCREADEQGMSVILDGVFNHTGCDSRYFNKYGNYPGTGAFQSETSPYRRWYKFSGGRYGSWWGVDDLPDADENEPSYRNFICGPDGVVRRWLRAGAKGWRLDVADELPDDFIADIRRAVLETRPDGLLLGEVWEDASNKISYGKLRRYLLGSELDSVMDYPLRRAVVGFLTGGMTAPEVCETLDSLRENYPPEAYRSALNLLGSHDRPRILTVLGGAPDEKTLSEDARASFRLSEEARGLAKGRLWLAELMQMTLPGVPCVYYGDEAGMEGYSDPFNRAGFPWGREDADAGEMLRNAVSLRKTLPLFVSGSMETFSCGDDVFGFLRREGDEAAAVLVNRSLSGTRRASVPLCGEACDELVGGVRLAPAGGSVSLELRPLGSAVVYFHKKARLAKPMPRGAGVLCPVTALPNPDGPGNVGAPARKFLDFLAGTKQRYWQILPVNPTDEYGSPYAGASAFAGNVSLLDTGGKTLRELYKEFTPDKAFTDFRAENAEWLAPYALFSAIRDRTGGPWRTWPAKYRTYSPALADAPELAEGAAFHEFCQFEFMRQWDALRACAREKGILIIGDMPMYVSADSADAWAEPRYFALDEAGGVAACAGVPPDYFARDGQLWGNPVFDWDALRTDGYSWWLRRLARAFRLYDYVRLDHFRGFEAYWAVPAGKKAVEGRWVPGPGAELFETAAERFGPLPVIAEDLGRITPGVRALIARCGFPGMDVLQFADGDVREAYEPPAGKIAYTGTHDNQTLAGWCRDRFPDCAPADMAARLMLRVLRSGADVAVLPLPDVLGLGDEARINTPGTAGKNWQWQASRRDFIGASKRLLDMTELSGRG